MTQTGQNRTAVARLIWIALAALLVCSAGTAGAAEKRYTVQRNDTLYGIARRSGVSVAQLAERNKLSRNAHIYAGQILVIPEKSGASATPPAASTPRPNTRAEEAASVGAVAPRRWKHIVIHHSGVNTGTLEGMDRYHREQRHMENGLAYHFVIGNGNGMKDGEIAVGRRWRQQLDGGHLASESQNKVSIGICLVGNFDSDKPTTRQLQNLDALVKALMKRCNLPASAVKTHRQINVVGTRCPGRHFPSKFLQDLRAAN